jgi:hypothetical protein
MKTRSFVLSIIVLVVAALFLSSCGRVMSDADYVEISEEFTNEFVHILLDPDSYDEDIDIEELASIKLEEVAQRYGYNARMYLKKAEELDEDWDDIWERIEVRLDEEFRRIYEESEMEEELEFESTD